MSNIQAAEIQQARDFPQLSMARLFPEIVRLRLGAKTAVLLALEVSPCQLSENSAWD